VADVRDPEQVVAMVRARSRGAAAAWIYVILECRHQSMMKWDGDIGPTTSTR